MTAAFVRRAGTGLLPGGRHLTWSAADGRRGRRWRSITTSADGRLVASLLLETAPDGVLTRLELATSAGLLTLHPEPDASGLHGNIVRPSGLEHVALPWSPAHQLFAAASPVTGAVAAARLDAVIGAGEGASVPAVEVGEDLVVRRATWRAAHVAADRWRLLAADGSASLTVTLDADGLPAALEDGMTWPMELDAG
ncbi:MAG: hypothetical protein WCK58_16290, partial [Chloroflexota bacterium]